MICVNSDYYSGYDVLYSVLYIILYISTSGICHMLNMMEIVDILTINSVLYIILYISSSGTYNRG